MYHFYGFIPGMDHILQLYIPQQLEELVMEQCHAHCQVIHMLTPFGLILVMAQSFQCT